MSNIFKLARKFQLKIALGQQSKIEKEDKAKEKLAIYFKEMRKIILQSAFFKPIMEAGENAWSTSPLNENAKQAREKGMQIVSGILFVDNSFDANGIDGAKLSDVLDASQSIAKGIEDLVNSKGTDLINQYRSNFLFLYDLEESKRNLSAHTSSVHSVGEQNMNKEVANISNEIINLSKFFTKRNGILNITAQLIKDKVYIPEEEMPEDFSKKDIKQKSTELTFNEKVRTIEYLAKELGLDQLGLILQGSRTYWEKIYTKYVAPLHLEDDIRSIYRAIFRTADLPEGVSDEEKSSSNVVHLTYGFGDEKTHHYKKLPPKTMQRIQSLKNAIHARFNEIGPREELEQHRRFGDPSYTSFVEEEQIEPVEFEASRSVTQIQNVSDRINKLKGLERHFFSLIPTQIQIKIRNGQIDLDAALQVSNANKNLVQAGQKLDPKLFLPLEKSFYEESSQIESIVEPSIQEEEIEDLGEFKQKTPFEQIMAPVAKPIKPLTTNQVQDLVNNMPPKMRILWLTQVRNKATEEEKNNIRGADDIMSLIEKYTPKSGELLSPPEFSVRPDLSSKLWE